MAKYTIELNRLVESGYNIFDDSWDTFIPEHKAVLCDKILRRYWFYEIGSETPDRFKHYLNEQLARIMPYYNQLYQSELLKMEPLFNFFIEGDEDNYRSYISSRDTMRRDDINRLKQMADSLKRIEDGTANITGTLTGSGSETWNEDVTGQEHETSSQDTTGKEVTDTDTTDTKDITKSGTQNATETGKETMEDTASGSKTTDGSTSGTSTTTKRYSDTPQAQIKQDEMSIEQQYLTNYTRDNGTTSGTSHETQKAENTETKTTDTTKITDTTSTDTEKQNNKGTVDTTVDTTVNVDGQKDRNYSEDRDGSKNTTKQQDTTDKQVTHGETGQFSSGSIQDNENVIGAENERKKDTDKSKNSSKKKGFTVSQSELLEAYRKTFINVDAMIINQLAENFMGVF